METNYIVIIEVDHVRAQNAYKKGMADLLEIWPDIMRYAEEKDAESAAERALRIAARERMRDDYERRHKHYMESLERLAAWQSSTSFFKGPKPVIEAYPGFPPDMLMDIPGSMRINQMRKFDYLRNQLQRRITLTGAAVSPFKMPADDVMEMTEWEDGTRIEQIKKEMA